MMNRDEVIDLLSAITAYDNRNATRETVLAWSKAAEIGRWTLPEALEAVHAHFAESTEYLLPGHVTQRIKAERQDRHMRQDPREIEAPANPAAAERIQEIVAEVGEKLGWAADRDRSALTVACPFCRAQPRERCTSKDGRQLKQSPAHPARIEAQAKQWREAAS